MGPRKNKVLLDKDSLKRHFDTVDPDYRKLFLFYISNKYNEFINSTNFDGVKNIEKVINEFSSLFNQKDKEINTEIASSLSPNNKRELIIKTEEFPNDQEEIENIEMKIRGILDDQEVEMIDMGAFKDAEEDIEMMREDRNKIENATLPISEIINVFEDIDEDIEDASTLRSPMNTVYDGIILGVIPRSNQIDEMLIEVDHSGHPNKIHIISLTDEFEQGMPGMLQPKELDSLTDKNAILFEHSQVPITDFGADISAQSVLATVYKMREIIESGGIVYIHCKAGRARSAMIVATYLAIFDGKIKDKEHSLKLAVQKLKNARPQVNLHEERVKDWGKLMETSKVKKLQKAQETINLHRAIKKELEAEEKELSTKNYIETFNKFSKEKSWEDVPWDRPRQKEKFLTTLKNMMKSTWSFKEGNSLLSTHEFKNDLVNLTAFKQLKIEIMQSKNPLKNINKKYLRELNKKIYEATDDSWYTEFKDKKGPLWKLYVNSKITDDLRATINSFIREIEIYKQDKINEMISDTTYVSDAEKKIQKIKPSFIKHGATDKRNTEAKIFSSLANYNLEHATQLANGIVNQAHDKELYNISGKDVKATDMIRLGGIYAKLMLDAAKVSGLPLSSLENIQFNFCITELPSDKETIQKAIVMYVKDLLNHQKSINDDIPQELLALYPLVQPFSIKLPNSSTNLHQYDEVLSLRGQSFCNAAKMIIDYSSELTNDALKNSTKEKIEKLFESFKKNIHETYIKREHQAYYDAYIQSLKELLIKTFREEKITLGDKEITDYLKNAEALCNIKHKTTQVTISGNLDVNSQSLLPTANLSLQIDEPLTKFKDLSIAQQQAWIEAIQVYQKRERNEKNENTVFSVNEHQPTVPKWFDEMPIFEKNVWIERLEVDDEGHANMAAPMVPVVKKHGVPGLRNLALSRFATLKYSEESSTPKIFVSEKSVRSSNLVVQKKEASPKLSNYEKTHTKLNIDQINHVYKENEMEQKFITLWNVHKDRPKHLLCQTLVRKFSGGDDNVIKHKSKALEGMDTTYDLTFHESNHCIGSAKYFHGIMHVLGANTTTMKHVVGPVADFITVAVVPNLHKAMPDRIITEVIKPIYELALEGKLSASRLNKMLNTGYINDYIHNKDPETARKNSQQINAFKRVLLALSMYKQINDDKYFSFKKHNQLHLAALEEIIYQDTGNRFQSSCKSGKDREGMQKNYRNAMLKFYDEYGYFPPAQVTLNENQTVNPDRENFIRIFKELFKTNHQARLAELNAEGCQGLKALQNILPKDILNELNREYRNELESHKENSSLNVLGVSHIVRDNKTYKHAMSSYKEIISDASILNIKGKHT